MVRALMQGVENPKCSSQKIQTPTFQDNALAIGLEAV